MTKKIMKIQIVGPYASEYSLARVNRGLAAELAKKHEVVLFDNENPQAEYAAWQKGPYASHFKATDVAPEADVAIFNNFPKTPQAQLGLAAINARVKIAYLAWEESIYPAHFVSECNANLHGIATTSDHVMRVFRHSGVMIPMVNVLEGKNLNFDITEPVNLKTSKKFKFLHVSSGHYRKGVDVLLSAYFDQFTASDDVCLVLKVFANSDSEFDAQLQKFSEQPDAPEVEIIAANNLSDGQMVWLYKNCDCLVMPSRAEGFGLPMLEGLAAGIPLITTNYSGQTDFCTEQNSWLLDYQLIQSKSHLSQPGALVAEPDQMQLQTYMRSVYEGQSAEITHKSEKGISDVAHLTWEESAKKIEEFVEKISLVESFKHKKFVLISPYGSAGGVAEHARDKYTKIFSAFEDYLILADHLDKPSLYQDDAHIDRCWSFGNADFDIIEQKITNFKGDVVHIEYNTEFFKLDEFGKFVADLRSKGRKVFVTLHAVQVPGLDWQGVQGVLGQANKIFVHSESDHNFLVGHGYSNISLINLGIQEPHLGLIPKIKTKLGAPIIATHGLIHDKKGFLELIRSFVIVKQKFADAKLLMLTAHNPDNMTSSNVLKQIQDLLQELELNNDVYLITEFLSNDVIRSLLNNADLVVFPYAHLMESASGAVRKAIALHKPIIITDSFIFNEIKVGYRVQGNNPEDLAKAINHLLSNTDDYEKLRNEVKQYARSIGLENLVIDYLKLVSESF